MSNIGADEARDLAMRLAGATHSRRVYASSGPIWERTLGALAEQITHYLDRDDIEEVTFALLGDGIAVCGVPIHAPPSAVARFIGQMKRRDVEIIAFAQGATPAEMETLLTFLSADAADVMAVNADTWLKDRGAEHVKVKHLKLTKDMGLNNFRDVYRRGVGTVQNEFRQADRRGSVNPAAVGELAKTLMEVVYDGEAPVATLLALRDRDDYSMVHSINVGVLAACQASALGMNPDEVHLISMAGLLHDIGKSKVPSAIIQKNGPLNAAEAQLMAVHTVEGARILLESKGLLGVTSIVAFSHHRVDGKAAILGTELVRIADAFDGLRTLRPFDDVDGMRATVSYMIHFLRNRFNPYLLERFATICHLFRIGDRGYLTTGEVAEVMRLNPELALRPMVRVIDKGKGASPAGTVIDLTNPPAGVQPALMVPLRPEKYTGFDPAELDALG